MSVHDDLGNRMKEYYEQVPKTRLVRRMPVVIRIDGKAFHTFTRGFKRPFDSILMESMQETMKYLCENIQGCVLGYTQSDEITLILVDYKKLNSGAFFDYEVQKLCSITASMATMYFNKIFNEYVNEYIAIQKVSLVPQCIEYQKKQKIYNEALKKSVKKGAMFDSRCFNVPKEEVTNLIYWRQIDAIRNSIQMVGQANFSDKELNHKSQEDIKQMLYILKNIDWNNYPIECKHGTCCIYTENGWSIDKKIPVFKDEGRNYIDKLVFVGE